MIYNDGYFLNLFHAHSFTHLLPFAPLILSKLRASHPTPSSSILSYSPILVSHPPIHSKIWPLLHYLFFSHSHHLLQYTKSCVLFHVVFQICCSAPSSNSNPAPPILVQSSTPQHHANMPSIISKQMSMPPCANPSPSHAGNTFRTLLAPPRHVASTDFALKG